MNCVEMPEAECLNRVEGDSENVPTLDPTYIGSRDKGQGTNFEIPQFTSYRITSSDSELIYTLFKGTKCIIGHEFSKSGVEHYHVIVIGMEQYEAVKRRLIRAKLGVNKYWSKQNHGDFLKAVAYTIKCGDYYSRKGADVYITHVEDHCPWVPEEALVCSETERDKDKDWMLTYNNLLRVAGNHAKKQHLQTDDLGAVLRHLTATTRWIPSPQMMKAGLDPYYFKLYKYRVGTVLDVPDWWTPHTI